MKIKSRVAQLSLVGAAAFVGMGSAQAGGFSQLSSSGTSVLKTCNPSNSSSNTNCKVTSLPGESGYDQVASRSTPLVYNGVTIGTLYEKVWRNCADTKLYIFGSRVVMTAAQWDSSGAAFNVNDLFKQTLPDQAVSAAYYPDGATKALQYAGRTVQGLNEYDGSQPDRDNTWVAFRVDANAAETSGASSAKSPWVLTKTKAPTGYESNALGTRILNSDVADFFDAVDFYAAGYQPKGVPPPGDDGDD